MQSARFTRRSMLGLMGATATLPLLGRSLVGGALAAESGTVTIAYNVNLPTFDPTVGASAVNPTIQSLYQAVFDPYIGQKPDLAFKPGLLTKWSWNDDRTKCEMEVREGATWHNGDPVTAEDVVWSLERAGDEKTGNPIQFVWSKIGNFKTDGNKVTADVKSFEPTLFKWMAFLTGYVLPKKYYSSVGAEGFEKKPVGSGPYMVDEFQQNAFLRLKANPNYWGGKPAFDTVVFKFVPDATSRVAELESGQSDVTLEIPYEEFDRLKKKGFVGYATPISDIGMIFINDVGPMTDKNVRLAANYAIDKNAIVDKLLRGYGVPISTLEAPTYAAFDASIKVPYDPKLAKKLLAASGYSQAEAGQLHDPDHPRLQAQGLRNDPGDRRHVAEGRHRGQHRGLRDRQALRAPRRRQARAGRLLQLGQCHRRPVDLDRLRHVRPLAALGLGRQGHDRHDRPALGRARRGETHRRLQGGRQAHRRRRRGHPAPPIRPADPGAQRPQAHAARQRHAAAADDHVGVDGWVALPAPSRERDG